MRGEWLRGVCRTPCARLIVAVHVITACRLPMTVQSQRQMRLEPELARDPWDPRRCPTQPSAEEPFGPSAEFSAHERERFESRPRLIAWPRGPQQETPWSPVRATPYNRLVDWVFARGMPDPRGARYVRAKVVFGHLRTGFARVLPVHGWLLGTESQTTPPLVLAWNGHVYEALSVEADVDINMDIANSAPDRMRCRGYREDSERYDYRFAATLREAAALLPWRPSLVTTVLLLRLNRAPAEMPLVPEEGRDMRVSFVEDYSYSLYQEAVFAHTQREHATVIRNTTQILSFLDSIEDPLLALDPSEFGAWGRAQVEALLADDQRRWVRSSEFANDDNHQENAASEHSGPVSTDAATQARIHALIDSLEFVRAPVEREHPPSVFSIPAVQELIAIGPAAIEPLLTAYERDERLTLSDGRWQESLTWQHPLPVRVLLLSALQQSLHSTLRLESMSNEGHQWLSETEARARLIQAFRAHHARVRNANP